MSDSGVDHTPPATNIDFKDLTLPRDKFSPFRYFFVVRPHCTFFLLLDLALIGVFSVWLKLREATELSCLFFSFGILITTCFIVPMGCADKGANIDGVTKDTRSSLSFLGEVMEFRPGLDMSKWDLIAARLNRVFYHNNNNITPYFFYDGEECHSYFKSWYVDPAKARSAKRSETENADEGSSGVKDTNKSKIMNIVQPKIDEAVKVYTDGVAEHLEKYWKQYMAHVSGISDQSNFRNDSNKDQTAS